MAELAIYQVALKLLLRKNDQFLILQDTYKSLLDLPGGRMNADEFTVPLEDILRREVTEELGADITYTINKPLFQFRRYHDTLKMPVLLTIYGGTYKSGEIQLSEEHESYQWIHKNDFHFPAEKFFSTEEYDAMNAYFKTLHLKS